MNLLSLNDFHFIRPWWLILIPLAVIIWFLLRKMSHHSQWQDHLPNAVIDALQVSKSSSTKTTQWAWLITWVLICTSAAGPSWLRQAVPVMQNQNATVIILDLSQSMLAQDLTPDRLTLAKYKLIDVLRLGSDEQSSDGQVALIAYSGGAYTVSPLTDDPKTIEALLPALHPNVMPSLGSNVEEAIAQANTLLLDAGIVSGQILLLTDGVPSVAFNSIEKSLSSRHSLSILGIGSNEAAPVPLQDGSFMRKANGEIVLATLNVQELRTLASKLGGKFAQISSNESDLNFLLNNKFIADSGHENTTTQDSNNSFDQWNDMGHYLLLLILPIFLLFFRKGLIYSLPIISLSLMLSPNESYAASTWDKLWKNSDQIGADLIENEQYSEASTTFNNEEWSAVAAYKDGDYATTIERLAGKSDINSLYNSANAFALNGDLDKAIENYKKVLELNPDHAGAQQNIAPVEQLKRYLEQEKQQQKSDENSENGDSKETDSEQDQSQQSDSEQNESEQENENQQKSKQPPQEQGESEQQSSQQEASEQQVDNAQEQANNKTTDESSEEDDAAQEKGIVENSEQESDEEAKDAKDTLAESAVPLKDSSQQWLRSIEDDPSGLLRRKFEYQAWQRQQQGQRSRQKKDDSGQQRY